MFTLTREAIAEAAKFIGEKESKEFVWKTTLGYVSSLKGSAGMGYRAEWVPIEPTILISNNHIDEAIAVIKNSGDEFGLFSVESYAETAGAPVTIGEIMGVSLDSGGPPIVIAMPLIQVDDVYLRLLLSRINRYGQGWLK
jgi:hypothetical protein